MKRNGFTLIELLAVIVILAIIALIATPIILGIISDAKKESQERSAELYLSGVDLAVARKNLTQEFSPEECTIENGAVTCTIDGEEVPLEVEVDGEVPVSGTIKFENNKVAKDTTLTFEGFSATINEDGKLELGAVTTQVIKGVLNSVCKPSETQSWTNNPLEVGYKYECDVDPTKKGYDYSFYVLTDATDSNAESVNLIMDSNINDNGEAVKENVADKGFINVINGQYAPVVAMNYLEQVTSTWTNLNPIEVSYYTDGSGQKHQMGKTYNVNARLPYYNEVSNSNYHPVYSDNLKIECYRTNMETYDEEPISCDIADSNSVWDTIIGANFPNLNHIAEVGGYYLLSAEFEYATEASYISHYQSYAGYFNSYSTFNGIGVRPVITLSK
ncbi:MAG: prepilin-type N-terminal cleavage/methylation domain-containing protein [Bacilli bacterium]|nr:prepilin-type N-terminal cleavage/methylation domain-containing protein [Bacilli bacterium]